MLQPHKSYLIISRIKEVEAHEDRSYWTLVKNSEVNNKHKNKYRKLKNISYIWYFKRKRFSEGRLMKHKARLCSRERMHQWGVNYWETYTPVVNWISVRSLIYIAIIHEFPRISINFVRDFLQADLDVRVCMELPSGIGTNVNRG